MDSRSKFEKHCHINTSPRLRNDNSHAHIQHKNNLTTEMLYKYLPMPIVYSLTDFTYTINAILY